MYLCYWMRQSGLADLLPSLRPEAVYVGTSGGAMVATPDFGGETYDDSEPLTTSDEALGLVDFSVFPHLDREDMPATPLANIERWAAGLSVPAYAIDDQTAIRVVDGNVEVVSEDTGSCSPPAQKRVDRPGDTRARLGERTVARKAAGDKDNSVVTEARPREKVDGSPRDALRSAMLCLNGTRVAGRTGRGSAASVRAVGGSIAMHMAAFTAPDHGPARIRASLVEATSRRNGAQQGYRRRRRRRRNDRVWGESGEREASTGSAAPTGAKGSRPMPSLRSWPLIGHGRSTPASRRQRRVVPRPREVRVPRVIATERGFAEARSAEIEEFVLRLDETASTSTSTVDRG